MKYDLGAETQHYIGKWPSGLVMKLQPDSIATKNEELFELKKNGTHQHRRSQSSGVSRQVKRPDENHHHG